MKRPPSARLSFPEGFVWGASTAAYQVEGAAHLEGRKDSIWDHFSRIPGAVLEDHDGEVAGDHYFRDQDDVALMSRLGMGAYRFSASWARVRPDGGSVNPAGLDFYSRLVDNLLARGVRPWLTLYHWDLPQALEDRGGWAERETAYRFAEYAVTMHERLGDRVTTWSTIDGPRTAAYLGYCGGQHAPGRTEPRAALAAVHHLLLGHGLATEALRSRAPTATIGLGLDLTVADPFDPFDEADLEAARRVDGQWNRMFLDPVLHGRYPLDVLQDVEHLGLLDHVHDQDLALISTPVDVLDVRHQHLAPLSRREPSAGFDEAPVTRPVAQALPAADGVHPVRSLVPGAASGAASAAEGLRRLLVRLQHEYTGPAGVGLTVTVGGGAADDVLDPDGTVHDPERRDRLDLQVRAVHRAVTGGVDVRGCFVASFFDGFEWTWGYTRPLGLIHVDHGTMRRTPKTSGLWYARAAAHNGIPSAPLTPAGTQEGPRR